MKMRTTYFLLVLLTLGVNALAQQAASVTWNCVPPDSQHVSAIVGNLAAQDISGADTFVVRSYTGTPNGPLGATHMRWWPYAAGAAVSWGNETGENPFRYVQLTVAPTAGNRFVADSVSAYLLGGGTSAMRVNIYASTDPTFTARTLLNTDSAIALLNSGSATSSVRFAYALGVTVNNGQSLYVRFYPYYTAAPSTSKYLYTQLAIIKGTTSSTNGVDDGYAAPVAWRLSQNYPNPFNPSTEIRYQTSEVGNVTLKVFDVLGREVATLVNTEQEAGSHAATFDASGLSSGMYFYKLQAGAFSETRKMMVAK
ncbi:MAG: T9SS type A sorting domain-containing protein [Ignavibacteriae bacterium]|nr:T9SS type A sorting domain-containing protein [Ignavibacteriota bacterium]